MRLHRNPMDAEIDRGLRGLTRISEFENPGKSAQSVVHPFAVFFVSCVLAASALAAPPAGLSVTVDPLEPDENGSFVYATIASPNGNSPVTGRFFVRARITNNSGATQTLTSVQAILYGNGQNIVRDYPRDLEISNDAVKDSAFSADEVIVLTLPAPPAALVACYFEGYPNDPIIVNRGLAAYAPLVGSYIYPADEGDIGPDEYFSGGTHLAPDGQLWGTDWQLYRITPGNAHTTVREGGDPDTNEGRLGWGVPIRAMAAGTVLRTSTGWLTNPRPGERAFQLMEEYDGELIADVKTTRLGSSRAATLQRLPSGQVQLSVWDITDTGRSIVRLGSDAVVPGENVSAMAFDALTGTRVVGIFRLSGTNNRRLVVWDIAEAPFAITRQPPIDTGDVTEVSLMKMTADRFATAVRNEAGNLEVSVWEADSNGISHFRVSDTAEAATSVCISALSATRIAASFRTADGLLKNIVWDYSDRSGYTLDRQGERTADAITRVVTSVAVSEKWTRNKWVTAFRTDRGGQLKLIRWDASASGNTLTPELETLTDAAITDTSLAVAPGSGSDGADNATTASILDGGTFKINGWGDPDTLPGEYEYSAQNTAGAVNRVSLDELSGADYVVAARTTGGALKLMTWHWGGGGGNSVYVLHGDCRVLYAHLQENSVDTSVLFPGAPVFAGQVLGRMGNSGASGGPHTHIHADRIYPVTSIPDMVARELLGTLPLIGSRPIPFTGARAMSIASIVQGGEGNAANSFATMSGHGMYDVALGIRPRLLTRYVDRAISALARNGLKEPVPGVFPQPTTGGPTQTVAGVLPLSPTGARLYIRGGSYGEKLTFSTPMTVRRYNYFDRLPGISDGPVIIGQ